MRVGRDNYNFRTGAYAGGDYPAYRYGKPQPKKAPYPIYRGEKRKSVIHRVMDILRDWRQSPFEHEGSARAGVRSALCLQGFDWYRADCEAAAIVAESLRLLGAKRPTWEQGQREYVTPRENCWRCGGEISEDMLFGKVAIGFCSEECARFSMSGRDYESSLRYTQMYVAAEEAIKRSRNPARPCEYCATLFRPTKVDRRFCSNRCADAANVILHPISCKVCRKSFKPWRGSSTYCSYVCLGIDRRKNPDVECIQCGKSFRRRGEKGRAARFCSRECAVAHRSVPEFQRICECCGTEFVAASPKATFCSTTCAQIVSKFRNERPPARISPPVLDYLFRRQGLRITAERMAA